MLLSKQALLALDWWWQGSNPWRTNEDDILPPVRPLQVTLRTDAATNNVGFGGEVICRGQKFSMQGHVRLAREEQTELRMSECEFSGMANTSQASLPVSVELGQSHVRETRDGGGVAVNKNVGERRSLLRLEGTARTSSEFSMARGPAERTGGSAFAPNQQSRRLATPSLAFS